MGSRDCYKVTFRSSEGTHEAYAPASPIGEGMAQQLAVALINRGYREVQVMQSEPIWAGDPHTVCALREPDSQKTVFLCISDEVGNRVVDAWLWANGETLSLDTVTRP
ncbi:hypothetical protein [Rhodococcus qingshengii]|uniref:hypothetical protein n=1 Tax=Rhodococcus qingshengii TaxID=334542 RepID=UPI0035DECC59